jgi:hypothetical protein
MHLSAALAACALVAAVALLAVHPNRGLPGLAALASGVEVAMTFQVVRIAVAHVPLGLVLGGVLLIAGGILLSRVSSRMTTIAATVVTLVGAIQVAQALHLVV